MAVNLDRMAQDWANSHKARRERERARAVWYVYGLKGMMLNFIVYFALMSVVIIVFRITTDGFGWFNWVGFIILIFIVGHIADRIVWHDWRKP